MSSGVVERFWWTWAATAAVIIHVASSDTQEPDTTMTNVASDSDFSGNQGAMVGDASGLSQTTQASLTFTLSPAHTIWGLSVEQFSYIFLIIGGVAPLLFIIITVIVMKCYSWKKRQRFDKYATQYRTAQELWELERQEYLNSAGSVAANSGRSPNRVPQRIIQPPMADDMNTTASSVIHTNSLSPHTVVMVGPPSGRSPQPSHATPDPDYLASSSNPNVYFKGGSEPPRQKSRQVNGGDSSTNLVLTVTTLNQSGDSSPNLTQITDISQDMGSARGQPSQPLHSPISEAPSTQNLGSEEAKALAAFDRIYENLDVSLTTSSSGEYSQAPSYIDTGSIATSVNRPTATSNSVHRDVMHTEVTSQDNLHTVSIENANGGASRLNPAFSSSSLSDDASLSPALAGTAKEDSGIDQGGRGSTSHKRAARDSRQNTTFINSAFVPDYQHES